MSILKHTLIIFLLLGNVGFAATGLISVQSAHNVKQTADRLQAKLKLAGMTVFARIDHAQAANKEGIDLRPTELIIFGNPKVGSPLMQCVQTVGIDLPQKALIWQDARGKVWLTYNDPDYLAGRHALNGCDSVLVKIKSALAKFAGAATEP